ncbi:MAG: hypothetical protein N2314_02945 [Brevinematales bacterium]|nr:hypothetical protein [Brevinematales bacterium]
MRWQSSLFVLGVLAFFSCSLRDYMNQPVLKDVYDGPMLVVFSPFGGQSYPGRIRVEADVREEQGLGDIEIVYEGKVEKVGTGGVGFYHLSREIGFSTGGWKTIEIRAVNRWGIRRSVFVDVNVVGPTIRVTNDFAQWGETYTSDVSLTLRGVVSNGLTNIERVYVRVERPSQTDEYTATMVGMNGWEVTIPLVTNQDVGVKACVVDKAGVMAEDRLITVYQDSRGPHVVVLTRPTNGATEAVMVVFEGKTQDDKVGAESLVWTKDNWATSSSRFLGGWWGMRDELAFWFEEWVTPGTYTVQFYVRDFFGNSSATNSFMFTVDGTYPYVYITGPDGWWCTNEVNFPLFGEYGNATALQFSLNGSPWQNVGQWGMGVWTNTTTYLANQENTLRLRAIDGSRTNTGPLYRLLIDTLPPTLSLYDTGGTVIVNRSSVRRRIRLEDNLSGIRYFYDTLKGKWGYGGMGYLVERRTNEWLGTWYEDDGARDFPFGAVITNEIVLVDKAGNSNVYTRNIEVYPAIFVTPAGGGSAFGIASDPRSASEGVEKAKSLGVRTVVFAEGSYTLSSSLVPANNMILAGGFTSDFLSANGSATVLTRSGGRVLEVNGVTGVAFLKFVVSGSGQPTIDGPIWVNNGTLYVMNSVFLNNEGQRGSAIYAQASQVGLVSNIFTNNRTRDFGVFFGAGVFYYGIENKYVHNTTQVFSNVDAQIFLVGGGAVISNHLFYLYEGWGSPGSVLIDVYARDMGVFLMHNSVFSTIFGSTNGVNLWLAGNMQQTSIVSNSFVGGVKYLMVKEGGWSGYQLRGNRIWTNAFTALWVEFLPGSTNVILSNQINRLNTPTETRATPDSTDNQGL